MIDNEYREISKVAPSRYFAEWDTFSGEVQEKDFVLLGSAKRHVNIAGGVVYERTNVAQEGVTEDGVPIWHWDGTHEVYSPGPEKSG